MISQMPEPVLGGGTRDNATFNGKQHNALSLAQYWQRHRDRAGHLSAGVPVNQDRSTHGFWSGWRRHEYGPSAVKQRSFESAHRRSAFARPAEHSQIVGTPQAPQLRIRDHRAAAPPRPGALGRIP